MSDNGYTQLIKDDGPVAYWRFGGGRLNLYEAVKAVL